MSKHEADNVSPQRHLDIISEKSSFDIKIHIYFLSVNLFFFLNVNTVHIYKVITLVNDINKIPGGAF